MYTFRWNHRMMFLNPKMDTRLCRMVAAHEIGHDCRHRDLAKDGALQEFVLFNMKDTTEYEANAFASHILLDSDQVYSLAREGYDVVQLSQMLGSNVKSHADQTTGIKSSRLSFQNSLYTGQPLFPQYQRQ